MIIRHRVGFAVTALLLGTAAAAGTLTPIAPYADPSSTGTSLLGINNAGWTTGSIVLTDGSQRGFLRDPSGGYTIFGNTAYPAALSTYGRAISNSNTVIGYSDAATGNAIDFRGFQRASDGTLTLLTHPADGGPQSGVPLAGISQGINDAGTIVGNYRAHSGPTGTGPYRNHGYILTSGGGFTELTDPTQPFASVNARGIANDGTVVGWNFDATNGDRGWIDNGGSFQYFAHPGDTDPTGLHSTVFEAINNSGMILGQYSQYVDDTTSYAKAFSFDPVAHSFTDIAVPGALNVQTFGINDAGQYVVSSDAGQFIYTPGGPAAPDGGSVFLPVSGGTLPAGQAQFAITVAPGTTYYIDPAYAHGFEYLAGSGPLFTSVTAPAGIGVGNHLALYLWNGTKYVFTARVTGGTAFDFVAPTARFELRGIPAGAGIDPTNPSGFVTGLTFASAGQFNGFQNALVAGVPEPATWLLLVVGFGVVGEMTRSRRRSLAA